MTEAEELELLRLRKRRATAQAGSPAPTPIAPPASTEGPSREESFLRGGAQGATLGFGDELQGAIQAAAPPATGAAALVNPVAALRWLADKTSGVPEDQLEAGRAVDAAKEDQLAAQGPLARLRRFATDYQQSRDSARRENDAAKEAHGGYYLGGNLAGGALTAPLMPGGAVKTAGQAALQGAKLGAAAGLGGSGADLTSGKLADVGAAAGDTALGAGLGALAGAGSYYVPQAIGAGIQKLRDMGESVAARLGRRVLAGGSESLAKGQAIPDDMVLDAIRRGIVKFGSTTKGALDRVTQMADEQGNLYGSILKELGAAGVQGPNAHRIAVEVAQDAAQRALEHPGAAGPEAMKKFADALAAQYQPGAADMPLSLAESVKRNLQGDAAKLYEAARRGLLPEGENLGEAKLALANKMKTAIEDAVQQQAGKAPAAAAAFQPAKAELSPLLRLRSVLEKGAAKVENRNPLGLYDMLAGAVGGATHGPLGFLAAPASALARAVGPSSGATSGLALSELAGALQGLPAAAERAFPGLGQASLTAGQGAANALQERIAQALRDKKLTPAQADQLQRQAAQAEALRQ